MRYIVLILLLLLLSVGVGLMNKGGSGERAKKKAEVTEEFIDRWLQNENGTIATYIQDGETEDEDHVQGREALAETLGLFMYYALEKDDEILFKRFYTQLNVYFLEDSGFVNWKLMENGTSDVEANALIDDIRIMHALVLAHEKWDEEQYILTAVSISDYLKEHNVMEGIYTNFYDKKFDYASSEISLSYIDVQAMNDLVEYDLLDADVVAETTQVLLNAPLDNGFYPLSYNVVKDEYKFSDDVNIVDQAILAYHYAQIDNPSKEFRDFIKGEMKDRGLVHGMYNRETKTPTVDYESPAIYGFLILYALEIGEDKLANNIYKRLKEFQVTSRNSDYYGGYSITNDDTHIFDNLIPMLAELQIHKKR